MRKETFIMNIDSRRAYVRPLIFAVVPAPIVLQEASPAPHVIVDPEQPGEEALCKKLKFDLWEEEDEETPTNPYSLD